MLETKQLTIFMSESLNHLFNRFIQLMEYIQNYSEIMLIWVNHWIINIANSFKTLINSEIKQVIVTVNQ